MKKKSDQLDRIIREKMNRLEVEYNPLHWAQFEQQLDAQEQGVPPVSERSLDEVVFEKLHNVQANKKVAHWDKLAFRLEEQVDVRRKLLVYKSMEMALLLLLFWVGSQYLPLSISEAPKLPAENKTNVPQVQAEPSNDIYNNSTLPKLETAASANNGIAVLESNKSQEKFTSGVDNQAFNDFANTGRTAADALKQSVLKKPGKISPDLPKVTFQQSAVSPDAISLQSNVAEAEQDFYPGVPERSSLLASLDQLMLSELESNAQIGQGFVPLLRPVQRRPALVVSMFGSGDYNQVITPRSSVGDQVLDRVIRYAPGYGGGITAGFDAGRWEIGAGVIYSAKKYQPRPVVHVGGSFFGGYDGEGLKYIELNMVQLPLYFRYNFIYHDKWRAYFNVGLALQVNFQTAYYFADEEEFLTNPLPRPTQEYTPADDWNLPGGWFDGGALWQNGYISGNLGFGVERYITGRWSIFAQPTYHHSLNYFTEGIGPDKDRINTLSIFTGVRIRLND